MPGGVGGVGLDVVGVRRFGAALRRTPRLAGRLFTGAELVTGSGAPRRAASLAARFAAKEAAAKAVGAPAGWRWHDCEVLIQPDGQPRLRLTGALAGAAAARGIAGWHVSLTHDADIAAAVVVAVLDPAGPR